MNMKYVYTFLVLSFCSVFMPVSARAGEPLSVTALFSDHMVLQQKSSVNIWGKCGPGERLTVLADWGKRVSTIADAKGSWRLKLKTPVAGGPYTITIKNPDTELLIKDILIGEVWLASGQSNMDIPLKGWPPGDTILNSKKEIEMADYPHIRFFKVPFKIASTPLNTVEAIWTSMSPETAGNFSATAYFYARRLHKTLHVPIGIVQSSIGGTPAEAWTSRPMLEKFGDFNKTVNSLDRVKLDSNTPTALFNGMINPLVPYTFKGIIWYQGESNVGRAEQYKRLFPALIKDWRNSWDEELPFYYVQLAPYLYKADDQKEQSQKLRDAQRYGLNLPKSGMVTTLDIGYLKTAHPPYKQEVGDRLARFALNNDYHLKQVPSGPLYKSAKHIGNRLIVKFTSVGSGLVLSRNNPDNFEIAGKDKVFMKADIKILERKVILSNHNITDPVYARYAWSDGSTATLFNREGLPAATFTSEK
ncbi:9-O-acetylesterase [Pedobacter frigidisoli]|uniref:9-O-acetylesterase n=1 Tax=Pedobacter frigidisoli TaxID=2530455 RepID=A0A4R0P396_9SPHI|nr:sialate O-acetylesterase [Pedobacter frigidisoli]TCD11039.1 9-O-acetylesterase [Pedobacter frigidisoli]